MTFAAASRAIRLGCVAVGLVVAGCDAAAPAVDECAGTTSAPGPTWDNFGHAFFISRCQSCHASTTPNRFGAPIAVTFDSESQVVGQKVQVFDAVITNQTMPIGGGVPTEDLDKLTKWLNCQE